MIWKIIFWLFLVIGLPLIIRFPFKDGNGIYDYLGAMMFVLSLIVIYGNAYRTAIGNKAIAITVFFIILAMVSYITYILVLALIGSNEIGEKIGISLSLLFALIYISPIFRYAFMSNEIWSKKHIKSHNQGKPQNVTS